MLGTLLAAALIPAAHAAAARTEASDPHQVIEVRQYKISAGQRDEFIALFERTLIEGQEDLGMRLVGQFRDGSDPDRFTWIRSFPNMAARAAALNAFYFGPVWKANRDVANPFLEDNDNVLLLRPAAPDLAFPLVDREQVAKAPAGVVLATIEYLWKMPDEALVGHFRDRLVPLLAASGLEVIGAYVPEEAENDFPRLPVRREKVFVWFARADSEDRLETALAALAASSEWRSASEKWRSFQERPPQQLKLRPTARSALN